MAQASSIQEPKILTANTYFWSANSSASGRRSSESRKQSEVESFFIEIGMKVSRSGDTVIGKKDGIVARFSYSESCKNCYKSLTITRNGANSNITSLRKLYAK